MNLETKRLIYSYYNPPYNHENKYAREKEILITSIFFKELSKNQKPLGCAEPPVH